MFSMQLIDTLGVAQADVKKHQRKQGQEVRASQ